MQLWFLQAEFRRWAKFFSSKVVPFEKNYFNSTNPQKVYFELWFTNVGFSFFETTEQHIKWTIWFFINSLKLLNLAIKLHQKEKRSRRSFLPNVCETCHNCQNVRPSFVTFSKNEASEGIFDDANKLCFLWSLMRVRSIPQSISIWTGFHILFCSILLPGEQPLFIWIVLMLPRQRCIQYTK